EHIDVAFLAHCCPIHQRLHISPLFPYTTLFRSDVEAVLSVFAEVVGKSAPSVSSELATSLNKGAFRTDAILTHPTFNRFHSESRSEEHTSELQSRENLVCRLLLEKIK